MLNHNQSLKTILIFCLITISRPAYSSSFYENFRSFVGDFDLVPINWLFSSESWDYSPQSGDAAAAKALFENDSDVIADLNNGQFFVTSTHVHKRSNSFFVNLYYRALNVRYKKKVSLVRKGTKTYSLTNNNDSPIKPSQNDDTEYGFMDALRGMGCACLGSLIFSAVIYRLVPKINIKGVELGNLVAGASLLILPIRQFFNPLGQVSLKDLNEMTKVKKSGSFDTILKEYKDNKGYVNFEKYTNNHQ